MLRRATRRATSCDFELKTDGVQFRVAGPAKPKQDYKDKDRQATTRDGEPIWTVRLDAIEPDREAQETIWVEVAGDTAQADLRWTTPWFAAWCSRRGSGVTARSARAFRAESVEPAESAQVRAGRGLSGPARHGTIPYPRSDPRRPHDQHPASTTRPVPARRCPSCRRCRSARWWSASPTCSRRQPTCPSPATSPCPMTQQIDLQFAPASSPACGPSPGGRTRFGSVVTSKPAPGRARPETWCRTRRSATTASTVKAYAHIPAAPASN